jgi:hypothetical protein
MSYGRDKSRYSRIAILVSLILHGIAFLAFVFVKLYTDEAAVGASVPVTFVAEQKIKLLRRSLKVRSRASLKHSETPQSQPTAQKVDTCINCLPKMSLMLVSSHPQPLLAII